MKKKKTIGRGDAFYIEHHFGTETAEKMAEDLGLVQDVVVDYVDGLKASGVEPAKKKQTRLQKAGFVASNGTVVATSASSTIADEHKGTSPFSDVKKKPKKQRDNPDIIFSEPNQ